MQLAFDTRTFIIDYRLRKQFPLVPIFSARAAMTRGPEIAADHSQMVSMSR